MSWYHYVFGAVLIIASVIITIVVLMQEGRSQNLSGAIAGGAETFLGKFLYNCSCCIPCISFYRISF